MGAPGASLLGTWETTNLDQRIPDLCPLISVE